MSGMIDTMGPDVCSLCGSEWAVQLIEIKVGKDIIEVGKYFCERCDWLDS